MTSPPPRAGRRAVVLCADDYAISEGVASGILDLAARGRLSATSAMVTMPAWAAMARELDALPPGFGVGLHLNLTEGAPLAAMPRLAPNGAFPGLPTLLRLALTGALPSAEIRAEIERQIRCFYDRRGRMPDFVDGHQHVHVLPGIRDALLAALAAQPGRPSWLRDPAERVSAVLARRASVGKALVVATLAAGFARRAHDSGYATNAGFSGFGPFDPLRDYDVAFAAFLGRLGPRPAVMCHPGSGAGADPRDPIGPARLAEHAYLSSSRFAERLERSGIVLVPAPAMSEPVRRPC